MKWWWYWLSSFIVDYSLFIVNLLILYMIMGSSIHIGYTLLFGISVILFCYCCSFVFKTFKGATAYFPTFNFIFGMFIPIVAFIPYKIPRHIVKYLLMYLYPFYDFQTKTVPNPASDQVIEFEYQYLIFQIFFYAVLLCCIEMSIFKRLFRKKPKLTCTDNVRLENIIKNYGEKDVLKNISFRAQKGDILALLGPNGAGKSTTFKILTNQTDPTSGDVYL